MRTLVKLLRREAAEIDGRIQTVFVWQTSDGLYRTAETWPLWAFWQGATVEVE